MMMTLTPLSAFSDNYLWLLDDGHDALVVDPGDAAPVEAALDARGLRLAAILVTHHHPDHVGGVTRLMPRLQGPIYGPAHEQMPVEVIRLVEGDTATALGVEFQVLDVPGHTAGHIAYTHGGGGAVGEPIVFCGDTLFSGGCGRLFEGTPAQMHASLAKLSALPDESRVCCAHEYTLGNLKFAHAVEPGNEDVIRHAAWCQSERTAGRPTLPSRIALERKINPFMRSGRPAVIAAARAHGASDDSGPAVLAAIRQWKDNFK